MKIYFDANPADGTVRFHHEALLGPRQIPAEQTEAERKAKKRPKMVDNPDCSIPAAATEIARKDFEALMLAQAEGKVIVMRRGKPAAVDHIPNPDEAREARRRKRDRLLAESDWTQLPDTLTLDLSLKANWADYRQQLRDLDMDGTDWPEPPDNSQGGSI